MNNWKKRVTQIKLSEEPYPTAEIECQECGQTWEDTEDPTCHCAEEMMQDSCYLSYGEKEDEDGS